MSNLPTDEELASFTREALGSLPIVWTDRAVSGHYQGHNPDSFDAVFELFDAADRPSLVAQAGARNRALSGASAPLGTVLSGDAFERFYDRPTRRALFVMVPLLSSNRGSGLLVVQAEDPMPSGGHMAVDHWVLMSRGESGSWHRRPIPAEVRRQLYLDDETGGGPLPTD